MTSWSRFAGPSASLSPRASRGARSASRTRSLEAILMQRGPDKRIIEGNEPAAILADCSKKRTDPASRSCPSRTKLETETSASLSPRLRRGSVRFADTLVGG